MSRPPAPKKPGPSLDLQLYHGLTADEVLQHGLEVWPELVERLTNIEHELSQVANSQKLFYSEFRQYQKKVDALESQATALVSRVDINTETIGKMTAAVTELKPVSEAFRDAQGFKRSGKIIAATVMILSALILAVTTIVNFFRGWPGGGSAP